MYGGLSRKDLGGPRKELTCSFLKNKGKDTHVSNPEAQTKATRAMLREIIMPHRSC